MPVITQGSDIYVGSPVQFIDLSAAAIEPSMNSNFAGIGDYYYWPADSTGGYGRVKLVSGSTAEYCGFYPFNDFYSLPLLSVSTGQIQGVPANNYLGQPQPLNIYQITWTSTYASRVGASKFTCGNPFYTSTLGPYNIPTNTLSGVDILVSLGDYHSNYAKPGWVVSNSISGGLYWCFFPKSVWGICYSTNDYSVINKNITGFTGSSRFYINDGTGALLNSFAYVDPLGNPAFQISDQGFETSDSVINTYGGNPSYKNSYDDNGMTITDVNSSSGTIWNMYFPFNKTNMGSWRLLVFSPEMQTLLDSCYSYSCYIKDNVFYAFIYAPYTNGGSGSFVTGIVTAAIQTFGIFRPDFKWLAINAPICCEE